MKVALYNAQITECNCNIDTKRLQLGLCPNDVFYVSIFVIQLKRFRIGNRATRLQIRSRNDLFDRDFYLLTVDSVL